MPPRPGTKIARVLAAVRAGWENSPDIAAELRLPANHVTAYLLKLERRGFVRIKRRHWGSFHPQEVGRPFHLWEAT